MAINPQVLEAIKEGFSALIESVNFGVEEDNVDPDLGDDLVKELAELRDLVLENI